MMGAQASSRTGRHFQSWLGSHWPAMAPWFLIVAYVAYFGSLTMLKHNAFQTTAFDLGNVDQAVWNTRHGRPFAMTNIEGLENRLGTHVEPILLPISLLYFVWSDPRALLLLQTVVIALGAWPLYKLARRQLEGSARDHQGAAALALALGASYLLFPALQSANAFDFHAVALAPTFLLFALYFMERDNWGAFAAFAILTMSCKEDMPLLVAMLGIYALVVRRKWAVGLATVAVAAAWFLVAVGWVMPHFDTRGVSPLANRYAYLGDGPLEMAATVVTRPGLVLEHLFTAGNLSYLVNLLAPVAFLSLLAPQVLMLALPALAVNLLSTEEAMRQLEGFHYGAPLVPIAVASAAYGAAWLIRRFPRFRALPPLLAGLVLLASLVYHVGHGYTPLAAGFRGSWPEVGAHHRLGKQMASRIPTEASLAALPRPNPHASQRQQLSMIDRVEGDLLAPLNGADYVWLDVTDGWPIHPNDLKRGVTNLLAGEYGIEAAEDGWLLLQRGVPEKSLPDDFYAFARTPDPQPEYQAELQFSLEGEPALELVGFDLEEEPDTGAHSLGLYWRALRPPPEGLRLHPFFFEDESGQVLEDTSLRPMIATVWYPPQDWKVGEIVHTRTLPWYIGPTFSVGLGVMTGDNWEDVDRRLAIEVTSSELVVRLFDDNTWARLLQVKDFKVVMEPRILATPSPQNSLDVDFGKIRLLGYDLKREERGARDAVLLTLYWQAQERMDTSYIVFAQLLDPAGRVRSQSDSVPQSGGYPTFWWLPGEVVVDAIRLELPPEEVRAPSYRLIVGLYDPVSNIRLPVTGQGRDYVELVEIR
jgi:uncharacterized membrane protein